MNVVTQLTQLVGQTKKHDWLSCTLFNWVSWVELCRYKHPLRLQSLNFVKRRSGHAQKSAGPHGHFTKSISVLRFVRCFEVRPFTGETLLSRWAAALLRVSFSARCRLVICGIKSVRFRGLRVTFFYCRSKMCLPIKTNLMQFLSMLIKQFCLSVCPPVCHSPVW